MTVERLGSAAEVDAVMALDAICFERPWTRADYERELADPARCFIYVARVQAQIVGYCSFWRVFDEIHVNNFAVHPEWRRRGIGRRLLAHVLDLAAAMGAPRATLEVRRSNAAAVGLYAGAGFAPAGVRRAYYTHPVEDALILWREGVAAAPPPALT